MKKGIKVVEANKIPKMCFKKISNIITSIEVFLDDWWFYTTA